MRRSVEWAERRQERKEEGPGGKAKSRRRGKGAQIRRQSVRRQQGFQKWKEEAVKVNSDLRRQIRDMQESGQVQSVALG